MIVNELFQINRDAMSLVFMIFDEIAFSGFYKRGSTIERTIGFDLIIRSCLRDSTGFLFIF